jgi:type IV pilus assembly protein PilB
MSAVTQGPSAAAGALTGLARALVQQGKLRPDRAETLARKAVTSNTQFIDDLVAVADSTGLSANQIAKFAADTFGHPLLDLSAFDGDQLPRELIDRKLVSSLRGRWMPHWSQRTMSSPVPLRGGRSRRSTDLR